MDSSRLTRLNKHLDAIVYGRQAITSQNSNLFLEAIVSQQDRPACFNKLIASKCGLDAVQAAMRFNLTPTFFNDRAASLLLYLQEPSLKDIAGGQLLSEIVMRIVDPPIFWDEFRLSYSKGLLLNDAQVCFAWLLHHLISLPAPASTTYRDQAPAVLSALLASSEVTVRTFGQKIKHILATCSTAAPTNVQDGPGGRHDNDFTNFREIAILPTSDEVLSTDLPFLRPSAVLDDPSTESTRLSIHLDNQFRLLREDMLSEMREELQIAFKKKKGYHRGLVLDGLTAQDIHCGPEKRRSKWGFTLCCTGDIPQLSSAKDRKKFLNENRNFLRHQSLVCLIADGDILAFPTINRDEELLARKPAVVVLQLEGEASTSRVFLKLKIAQRIKLIQIDTAVFSYAPVLNALQQITSMPLSSELLLWKKDNIIQDISQARLTSVVQALHQDPRSDLKGLLGTSKSIKLDHSQAACLLSGLTAKLSLIQGPPGRLPRKASSYTLLLNYLRLSRHREVIHWLTYCQVDT